jgi:hypothetical protein
MPESEAKITGVSQFTGKHYGHDREENENPAELAQKCTKHNASDNRYGHLASPF